MSEIVSIEDLTLRYEDGIAALEDVNLKIYSSDFMAIIGPNGGGKSSLVKAIMGLTPYSGRIKYSDELRDSNGGLRIGYMPQVSLFDRNFPITLHEVVMSGVKPRRGVLGYSYYTKEALLRGDELMVKMGIKELGGNRISALSGGELQRGLLCRAVISQPKLLILDEPTNFIDNNFERELYVLLQELHRDMAIVMVSHDLGNVSTYVRQIACVNRRVFRHESNIITNEQLASYYCPMQIISHGTVPHTVLPYHNRECCKKKEGDICK